MNTNTTYAITLAITATLAEAANTYIFNRGHQSEVPWDRIADRDRIYDILRSEYGLKGMYGMGASFFGTNEDGDIVWLEIARLHGQPELVELVQCNDVVAGLSLLKVIWREENTSEANRALLDSLDGDWTGAGPAWTFEQFERVLRDCGQDDEFIREHWDNRPADYEGRFDERFVRLVLGTGGQEGVEPPAPDEFDLLSKLLGVPADQLRADAEKGQREAQGAVEEGMPGGLPEVGVSVNANEVEAKPEADDTPLNVVEWLKNIPNQCVRDAALLNWAALNSSYTMISDLHNTFRSLKSALICAFTWSDTPEGAQYWSDVTHAVSRGEKIPPHPAEGSGLDLEAEACPASPSGLHAPAHGGYSGEVIAR